MEVRVVEKVVMVVEKVVMVVVVEMEVRVVEVYMLHHNTRSHLMQMSNNREHEILRFVLFVYLTLVS